MADPTDPTRPTPPQLRIRLIGTPGEVDLAIYRLRQAFAEVEASEPEELMYDPTLTRVHARVVL